MLSDWLESDYCKKRGITRNTVAEVAKQALAAPNSLTKYGRLLDAERIFRSNRIRHRAITVVVHARSDAEPVNDLVKAYITQIQAAEGVFRLLPPAVSAPPTAKNVNMIRERL